MLCKRTLINNFVARSRLWDKCFSLFFYVYCIVLSSLCLFYRCFTPHLFAVLILIRFIFFITFEMVLLLLLFNILCSIITVMFGNNIFKVSLYDVFYVLDIPLCIYLRSLLLHIFFILLLLVCFFSIISVNPIIYSRTFHITHIHFPIKK